MPKNNVYSDRQARESLCNHVRVFKAQNLSKLLNCIFENQCKLQNGSAAFPNEPPRGKTNNVVPKQV